MDVSTAAMRTLVTIGVVSLWVGQADARPGESSSARDECARGGARVTINTAADELTGALIEVAPSRIGLRIERAGREFAVTALGPLRLAGSQTREPAFVAPVTQESAAARFSVGVGGLFGVPFGTLREVIGLTGGVGFEVAYSLPFAPMLLGFDGELWQHSTDISALNSDLAGHLLVRLQRSTGSFRPYADAVIGLDYIATHVQDVESPVLETRALGLGVGAGVTRRLSATNPVSLDLRARFRHASAADMLSRDLVRTKVRTRVFVMYGGFAVGW